MEERDIREVLAQELASSAASRRDEILRPPDRGHGRSASAVDGLIDYIRALPEDDARLDAIGALNRDPDFFLLGGEETRTLIDRYGYDTESGESRQQAGDRFLQGLIAAARVDDAEADERDTTAPG